MEELLALRRYIEQQRYTEALDLLAEMEEIPRTRIFNDCPSLPLPWLINTPDARPCRADSKDGRGKFWNSLEDTFEIDEDTSRLIRVP